MAEAVSHHLLEEDRHIFFLVEADGQPRPARHRTVYDDGTEGKTVHMLYVEDGEVRSVLVEA